MAHDYETAFAAARRCAADFDWDAVVPNMLATWTGMTQAMGLRYYMTPGIDLPANVGHQYREPPADDAWMKPDEYDALIEDPTGYLYNVWLPRVAAPLSPVGGPVTFEHNTVAGQGRDGDDAVLQRLGRAGDAAAERVRAPSRRSPACCRRRWTSWRTSCAATSGLVEDLFAASAASAGGLRGADAAPDAVRPGHRRSARNVPIGFWMHRGCVPFISPAQFDNIFWPTLKPIVQELWAHGHQTLFYAEGNWDHHLAAFAELPDRSIVYHVDQGDIFRVHRTLGEQVLPQRRDSQLPAGLRPADEVRRPAGR